MKLAVYKQISRDYRLKTYLRRLYLAQGYRSIIDEYVQQRFSKHIKWSVCGDGRIAKLFIVSCIYY